MFKVADNPNKDIELELVPGSKIREVYLKATVNGSSQILMRFTDDHAVLEELDMDLVKDWDIEIVDRCFRVIHPKYYHSF